MVFLKLGWQNLEYPLKQGPTSPQATETDLVQSQQEIPLPLSPRTQQRVQEAQRALAANLPPEQLAQFNHDLQQFSTEAQEIRGAIEQYNPNTIQILTRGQY